MLKEKLRPSSQIKKLVDAQEKSNIKVDELRLTLATKDVNIAHHTFRNQQLSSEGPGVSKELKTEN